MTNKLSYYLPFEVYSLPSDPGNSLPLSSLHYIGTYDFNINYISESDYNEFLSDFAANTQLATSGSNPSITEAGTRFLELLPFAMDDFNVPKYNSASDLFFPDTTGGNNPTPMDLLGWFPKNRIWRSNEEYGYFIIRNPRNGRYTSCNYGHTSGGNYGYIYNSNGNLILSKNQSPTLFGGVPGYFLNVPCFSNFSGRICYHVIEIESYPSGYSGTGIRIYKKITETYVDENNLLAAFISGDSPISINKPTFWLGKSSSYTNPSPIPEVSSVTNVGITDIGYYHVRFFTSDGQTLLSEEYVREGGDCTYGATEAWTNIVNSGIAVEDITENIQQSMDLYLARWCVDYYTIDGLDIMNSEFVVDGNNAVWGAGSDWSATIGGEAQPSILNNIHANISVYSMVERDLLYSWDFTQSLTDSIAGKTITIPSSMTRDSTGLRLNGTNECTLLNGDIALTDKSIEVTFTTFILATSRYCGILFISDDSGLIYTNDSRNWATYFSGWTGNISDEDRNIFANSKLGVYIDSSRKWHIYRNGVLFTTATPTMQNSTFLQLGDSRTTGMTSSTTVTGIKIYDGDIFGGS